MIQSLFKLSAVILAVTSLLCLWRGIIGPTEADRIVAMKTIGTKVVVIMALFSYILEDQSYLDVALIYALLSFIVTIAVAKYKKYGRLF